MIYKSNYGGFSPQSINLFKKSIREILHYKGYDIGVEYYPYQIRHNSVLHAGYGHIRGLKGRDGMALDCYIHPRIFEKLDNIENLPIYVIYQIKPWTGLFDEHKIMFGFLDREEAIKCYLKCMPKQMLGSCSEIQSAEEVVY
ncbi:MAG: hypothetical protein R3321_08295 [Nitrososphaeraceae archaeon]|nr:hypothetical protein [Nitrososphaeraceae archaeon]